MALTWNSYIWRTLQDWSPPTSFKAKYCTYKYLHLPVKSASLHMLCMHNYCLTSCTMEFSHTAQSYPGLVRVLVWRIHDSVLFFCCSFALFRESGRICSSDKGKPFEVHSKDRYLILTSVKHPYSKLFLYSGSDP